MRELELAGLKRHGKKHTKVQEILENNSSKPKIIRLLKKDHNSDKKTVLERGLKLTPTPKCDKTDLINDTEEFCRNLLRVFFFTKQK